jgi:hypothetical protein
MIDIVVAHNKIKKIFDWIPRYSYTICKTNEIMQWAHYCLSGGKKAFAVEVVDEKFSYIYQTNADSLPELPERYFGKQTLKTSITELNFTEKHPFTTSDMLLQMATGYLRKYFEERQTNPIDEGKFAICESDINSLNGKALLMSLIVQGLYSYDRSAISEIFSALTSNHTFINQLDDIYEIDAIAMILYGNNLGANVIVPYIFSQLPAIFMHAVLNNYPLRSIDVLSFDFEPNYPLIAKLSEALVGITFMHSIDFVEFVNETMTDFSKLLAMSPKIFMPYVMGLDDNTHVYSIGGVQLYNYAQFTNPLIRAYGFFVSNFGNCEAIETFYKNIARIDNPSLFEILESSKDKGVTEIALISYFQKTTANLELLNSYNYSETKYEKKTPLYWLTDKFYKTTVLDVLNRYIFSPAIARNMMTQTIYTIQLEYSRNKLKSKKQLNNRLGDTAIELNTTGMSMKLPVYDFSGAIMDKQVIFVGVPGTRLEEIVLYDAYGEKNNIIWLFTKVPPTSRYVKFADIDFGPKPRLNL